MTTLSKKEVALWDQGGYTYTFDPFVADDTGWEPVDYVTEEVKAGYMIGGKVILPAQVVTRQAYRQKLTKQDN